MADDRIKTEEALQPFYELVNMCCRAVLKELVADNNNLGKYAPKEIEGNQAYPEYTRIAFGNVRLIGCLWEGLDLAANYLEAARLGIPHSDTGFTKAMMDICARTNQMVDDVWKNIPKEKRKYFDHFFRDVNIATCKNAILFRMTRRNPIGLNS